MNAQRQFRAPQSAAKKIVGSKDIALKEKETATGVIKRFTEDD